jgi:hypothetical protein
MSTLAGFERRSAFGDAEVAEDEGAAVDAGVDLWVGSELESTGKKRRRREEIRKKRRMDERAWRSGNPAWSFLVGWVKQYLRVDVVSVSSLP